MPNTSSSKPRGRVLIVKEILFVLTPGHVLTRAVGLISIVFISG